MDGIIYMARNKLNDKVYIGQTLTALDRRKNGHLRAANNGSHLYFHRALRKYSKDCFEWSVLEHLPDATPEIMNDREVHYIAHYQSNDPELGYNMTKGGDAHVEMAQMFWDDDSKSGAYRQVLSQRQTEYWSDEAHRKAHKAWMDAFYATDMGIAQASRHSGFMHGYYNGEHAREHKAKTSHWFVKATSPDNEEVVYVSSKEPNKDFGRDIRLRAHLKVVGDIWVPSTRSPLYGWRFEAIPKQAI